MLTSSATVCVIGFGDAGAAAGAALAQRGHAVRAWDSLLDDPSQREMMRARIAAALVDPATSLADAIRSAKLVVCAVDGAAAAGVKREISALLVAGQELVDVESLGFAYDPAMRQTSIRGELP